MTSRSLLFGTNGIRGIVNDDLTPDLVTKIGVAIGEHFGGGDILLGYDARTSNVILSRALSAGLASAGTNVHDAGLAPTPALQFAVKHFKMRGAVIITASHNPPEYNGIKVVASDGIELSRTNEIEIEDLLFTNNFKRKSWDNLGKISNFSGIMAVYLKAIKNHLNENTIRKKNFKVVIDSANSVGALVTPILLRELGCDVITLNSNLDGHFPGRLPEPKPETLGNLSKMVKALRADLGIAHDGDADRCMFVDEKGEIVLGDRSGAIIVEYVLQKHHPSIVVTPISSSKMVEDVVIQIGSKIRWTKVGSTAVSREMVRLNSVIGMEDNGGIFYGPHQPVRDGAMSAGLMLEILAKSGRTFSELIASLPRYYVIKERLDCPNELKSRIHEQILKATKDQNRITIDGIKVFFDDGSTLIRPSGTEAVYRVYAEAKNEKRAKEIAEWSTSLVKKSLNIF